MKSRLAIAVLLVLGLSASLQAQSASCLDAADEPHHHVIFENSRVRVLMLELSRIESTQAYCYSHPYVYIVLGEGKSSTTAEGKGTFSHDWYGSETRLVYAPEKQVVRNESGVPFRELVVELLHGVRYNAWENRYDDDLFPGDLGTVKPNWTVSFTRGGVMFTKVQVAAGSDYSMSGHLLVALTDLDLRSKADGSELTVAAQDTSELTRASHRLFTNAGSNPARFIVIDF